MRVGGERAKRVREGRLVGPSQFFPLDFPLAGGFFDTAVSTGPADDDDPVDGAALTGSETLIVS